MSTSSSPATPRPCTHLIEYRSSQSSSHSNPFHVLSRCLRRRPLRQPEIRRSHPYDILRCSSCSSCSRSPRLYACLSCAAVLCRIHSTAHPHPIAVDVDRAELFCFPCSDQVYDPDFDAAVSVALTASSDQPPSSTARKRRRVVDFHPWEPDPAELALVRAGSRPLQVNGTSPSCGLRGLNNLGNTCFMNSVLQALLHAPPLRNYFLSDRHSSSTCPRQRARRKKLAGGNIDAAAVAVCLACDLDEIYSSVFSGDRTPYSPAKFLYSWWQHASNLASYEQQDAHEFFICILDRIHEMEVDKHRPQSHGHADCCIAHRVFSGILRSDVICTNCGFTSTKYDPCVDISLDLDSGHHSLSTGKQHVRNGVKSSPPLDSRVSTLMRCLERFTRPEKLDSEQKFFCDHCKERHESLKQMSIRRLPLISCFHIKRFEHSSSKKSSKKVDHSLQFPLSLDMAPYMSSSILRSRSGNRILPSGAVVGDSDATHELQSEFEIFAVISHTGQLDAGHYITYLRLNDRWYKCDDAWITSVEEHTVRSSQAYMLFYVQKTLHYRSCENNEPPA